MKRRYKGWLLALLLIIAVPVFAQTEGCFVVAQAQTDGSFTGIATYATASEAVAAAESNGNVDIVVRDTERVRGNGVIFMKQGIVITAPDRIGEPLLTFGDAPHTSYTGRGYDALFVSGDGYNVSILLSGMKGPVAEYKGNAPVDQVELVPAVQITAQSHYVRTGDGTLRHMVQTFTYDAATNTYVAKEDGINLGPAPSFIAAGRKYYSYNSADFYANIFAGTKAGYFEPYYKILPMRSLSNYTAQQLDAYIASWNRPGSALNGTGAYFLEAQNTFGVNAGLLLSMAAHESAMGNSSLALNKNNLFGVGAIDGNAYGNADTFHSVEDSILYQAQVVMNNRYLNYNDSNRYRGPHLGDKDSGMNVKYASDPYWAEKIVQHMHWLDRYLGSKDFGHYAIGWAKSPAYAYTWEGWPEAGAYPLHAGAGYPAYVPVILTGQGPDHYTARSIMPISGLLGDADAPYDWDVEVYIPDYSITAVVGSIPVPVEPEPEPEPTSELTVERVSGQAIVDTAIAISQRRADRADTVVLANGLTQIDALSAAPLAAHYDAPILLTHGKTLETKVLDEINRLGARHIILVGGEAVLSKEIAAQLQISGKTVTRFWGQTLYDTSAVVAKEVFRLNPTQTRAFLANGLTAVDALSVGPYAAQERIPILLTNGSRIEATVKAELQKARSITLLGGEKAIVPAVWAELAAQGKTVDRVAGLHMYDTSAEVAKRYYPNSTTALIATGSPLADGLAGSPLANQHGAPLLLTGKVTADSVLSYLTDHPVDQLFVLGGIRAVTPETVDQIVQAIQQ